MSKVTFDGAQRLILVNLGVTQLDFKEDVYSAWKIWAVNNTGWLPAIRAVGGEPLPGNLFLGSTFFLINDWRMRSWAGDHRLTINGNVFTEEGDDVFIPSLGENNVQITMNTSSIVNLANINGSSGSNMDAESIAQAVWNHLLANMVVPGSIGSAFKKSEKMIDDLYVMEVANQ